MSGMDMSGMDMSGMDMSGDSSMAGMNMYFVSSFKNYPVMFKNLKATSGGQAFGIFVYLFVLAFLLRGLSFLSLYLEQRVWNTQSVNITIDECECEDEEVKDQESEAAGNCCGGDVAEGKSVALVNKKAHVEHLQKTNNVKRSTIAQILTPGMREVKRDVVRFLIYLVTAMFGYALMIAAMSYVILYFFAICLGLAFGELFFNRVRIASGLNDNINGICGNLH